ncbi:Oidioi.mRNA.OKI2018_I69.chr2.g7211.t1.cds [Oikopleura dioica]|uniref:Oidioi.mRNA.OKI2018_I69.chr2.g7211.t1.cds n=1 Tax=Oikopleura dioica TaxID=34765 RepID=A0ABN7T6F5_OIKDI|nr:Oidioi.mRNA.OKI2018_I69.chr2.g7211.t1.cds [Oikopleura dioica]
MRPVELDPSRITSWGINGGSVDPKILEKALGETTTSSPEGEVSRVSPQREAPPPPTPMVKSQKKEKEKSPKMEKLEKKISRISMKLKPKGTAAPITVTALSANSPTNAEKSRNKPQTITNL